MFKLVRNFVLPLMIAFSMLVSGCAAVQSGAAVPPDGMMWAMSKATTEYGVQLAMSLSEGTRVMLNAKTGQMMLAWAVEERGMATLFIDLKTLTTASSAEDIVNKFGVSGLMNAKSASELVEWMKANGWKVATAEEISAALGTAATTFGRNQAQILEAMVNRPIFVIAPVGLFNPADVDKYFAPAKIDG